VIFRPNKIRFECPDCGLLVHDAYSVHCKHCGRVLHIPYEGFSWSCGLAEVAEW